MFASNIQPVLVGSLNRYDAKFHEKIRARRLGVLGEGTSPGTSPRYYKVWSVAGLVSFGVGCNETGEYSAYTNVSYYYDWIRGFINVPVAPNAPQYPVARVMRNPPPPPTFQNYNETIVKLGGSFQTYIQFFRVATRTVILIQVGGLTLETNVVSLAPVSTQVFMLGFGNLSFAIALWTQVGSSNPSAVYFADPRVLGSDGQYSPMAGGPVGLSLQGTAGSYSTSFDMGLASYALSWEHKQGGGNPWDLDWGASVSLGFAVDPAINTIPAGRGIGGQQDWVLQSSVLFPSAYEASVTANLQGGGSSGTKGKTIPSWAIAVIVTGGTAIVAAITTAIALEEVHRRK